MMQQRTVTRMAGISFKAVRDAVSVERLALHEGMTTRGGRIRCPFCGPGASRYNFKLNRDGSAYCFSCHKAVDAIDTAAHIWGMSKADAAKELNDIFHLGIEAEAVDAATLDRRRHQREAARLAEAEARAAEGKAWADACEAERAAQQAIERFTMAEAGTPAFDQALRRLCEAQQRCDVLQAARTGM